MLSRFYNGIQGIFTNISKIDYRSLAIFRIGIGLLIIIDLISRIPDLIAFYTDQGILSRFALLQYFSDVNRFSLYNINGQFWFVSLLFLISLVSALFLVLGYRTRLFTFISWVLLLSLHNRNELVLQGGDNLFHIVMFWSLFLNLGQVWSLDSLFKNKKMDVLEENSDEKINYVSNIASLAILVQVALTLLFAAILKTGNEWLWPNFTASAIAMKVNYLSTDFGRWLLNFPELLKLSTALLYWIEFSAPILLFFPFKNEAIRNVILPIIILMLVSFGLGLQIFLFPYIFVVSFLLFTPSKFWDWLANKMKPTEKLTFYYDQECSFCTTAACALQNSLVIISGQSKKDTLEAMLKYDSFIVEDNTGERFYKFDAILRVGKSWPLFSWLVPVFKQGFLYKLGNKLYEIIAKNRHKISNFIDSINPRLNVKDDECVSKDEIKTLKPNKKFNLNFPEYITQGLAAFFLIYILFWNVGESFKEYKIAEPLNQVGWTLGLNQRWDMFSPSPLKVSGWYVIPGKLADGTKVDVFNKNFNAPYLYQSELRDINKTNGSNFNFEEQVRQLPSDMNSQGWRKYLTDSIPSNEKARENFGGYLCRRWNDGNVNNLSNIFTGNSQLAEPNSNQLSNLFNPIPDSKKLHTFQLLFFQRTADQNQYSLPTKIVLMEYRCY